MYFQTKEKNLVATDTKELDTTISALEGDLTSLSPKTAVSNITEWQDKLEKSDNAGLKHIATELGHLKTHLSSGKLDGKVIGASLTKLGTETTKAAKDAEGAVATKLEKLGGLLSKAGKSLS